MTPVNLKKSLVLAFWDQRKQALTKLSKPSVSKLGHCLQQLANPHLGIDWIACDASKVGSVREAVLLLKDLEGGTTGAFVAKAKKVALHDKAHELSLRYPGFLPSDPLVHELGGNPFVPIAVQATLSTTLATLAAKIV